LHLGYHCNGRHFEFFQPPKAATLLERDKLKKIGMGWANFTPVAMEPKKVGFKKRLDSFHQTS
jgi:hypothetical protein